MDLQSLDCGKYSYHYNVSVHESSIKTRRQDGCNRKGTIQGILYYRADSLEPVCIGPNYSIDLSGDITSKTTVVKAFTKEWISWIKSNYCLLKLSEDDISLLLLTPTTILPRLLLFAYYGVSLGLSTNITSLDFCDVESGVDEDTCEVVKVKYIRVVFSFNIGITKKCKCLSYSYRSGCAKEGDYIKIQNSNPNLLFFHILRKRHLLFTHYRAHSVCDDSTSESSDDSSEVFAPVKEDDKPVIKEDAKPLNE